jgi:hypothetical protein
VAQEGRFRTIIQPSRAPLTRGWVRRSIEVLQVIPTALRVSARRNGPHPLPDCLWCWRNPLGPTVRV